MAHNQVTVETSMASAMGASLYVTAPEQGTYLVIGRNSMLEAIVQAAGGQVVMRLNGRKILAVMPFAGYSSLRSNYHISHIGPVTVNTSRLAALAKTLLTKNGS